MPLTAEEAHRVQRFHLQAVEAYADFPKWDLWDPSGAHFVDCELVADPSRW